MSRVIVPEIRSKKSVRNNTSPDEGASLVFTFAQFNLKPINIRYEFNNHFRDEQHYVEKISTFFGLALPLLSQETVAIFSKN